MLFKGVTLKGLEVFEALAATGSVAGASERTGLSQPAVSQQMRNLEAAVGQALVDHKRRPMTLTAAGRSYLGRVQKGLGHLRMAQSEVNVMDLSHLRQLDLGVIDDFDNDLTPRLVTLLAETMTRCRFKLVTAPSHEITQAMQDGELHIAVAASSGQSIENVNEIPLIRDPFLFVSPKGAVAEAGGVEAVMNALPILRYDRSQRIGSRIEAELKRRGHDFPTRFEIGAHLSLMTLVSRGLGWAISTSLGFMRAERLHGAIEAHPLPWPTFARTISLYAGADWAEDVPRDVAKTVQRLVQDMVITPAQAQMPWQADELRLLK